MLAATGAAAAQGQATAPAVPTGPTPELVPSASGVGTVLARAKESFATPSLTGSELKATQPLLGDRNVTAGFIRELYQVSWRPNDPIDLYVILPVGVKNPPVVLYLYSYPSDTDRFKDDRYCQRLVQNGVAAVGFVSALTGQRDEYRPPQEWFVSELPEALATTAHDVQMILNYLETRHDLDMDHVGMFGQGSGGAIAVLAASADPRIRALDLLNPWGDWPDWLAKNPDTPQAERPTYVAPEFLKKLEPLEPAQLLGQLAPRHLRIQFVDEGGEPAEVVKKLQAASPASASVSRYATGRAMWATQSDGRLFEWLADELKPHDGRPPTGMSANAEAPVPGTPAH